MASGLDFDEFYQATYHRVVGQVYAMTGSLSEAEDSVQEAYARAWQGWTKISAYEDAEAWVRAVAYRISISSWRKTVNRLTAHRRGARLEEQPSLSPDRMAIMSALGRIPAEQRQVIVLHHFLDRSVEEISAETGVPTGTVKSRLARGRRALAPHLSEFAEPGAPVSGEEIRKRKGRKDRKESTSHV